MSVMNIPWATLNQRFPFSSLLLSQGLRCKKFEEEKLSVRGYNGPKNLVVN
jgi:hypothetical protein